MNDEVKINETETVKTESESLSKTAQECREEIGQMLLTAREAKSYTRSDAAEFLKLRQIQIQQMEEGCWDELPAPAFTRGFIRRYAQWLGITENFLPLLNQALPSSGTPARRTLVADNAPQAKFKIPVWLKMTAIIIAITLIVTIWQKQSANTVAEQEQTLPEITNNTPDPAQGNFEVRALEPATTQSAEHSQTLRGEPFAQDPSVLQIFVRYRSFLTVSDTEGKVLINQIVPGGSTQKLSGKPPYNVRIGYALGAQVQYGGKTYETAPYLDGKTATMQIPQQ